MITIPVQPIPSQSVKCVLEEQNVIVKITQSYNGINADVSVNGEAVSTAVIIRNAVQLCATNRYKLSGALFIIDTQGDEDPFAEGLGERFILVYLSGSEL